MTASVLIEQPVVGPARAERRLVGLLGPAFVAAIAYVDPGNVAANLTAGADYGFLLLWVLVLANAAAVLVQYLSAKLGIVTGCSLPELLGARLPRAARLSYWAQAEVTAIATELAEVIGGAVALQILFRLPLLFGGLIVFGVSLALLTVESRRGQRTFEFVILGMLAVISIGFVSGLFVSGVDWSGALGGAVPTFEGTHSVLLAAGMVGATVMPHAIYAHSSLARDRHGGAAHFATESVKGKLLRATRWDVGAALTLAGGVNLAMLLLAATGLRGVAGTDTLTGAADAMSGRLGPAVGVIFGIGLLASGLASTAVGGYASSAIMGGLLHVRIPVLVRRIVAIVPALAILGAGVDPTFAVVLSQVVLSLGIPLALVPLVWLTCSPTTMGAFVNGAVLRVTAVGVTVAIAALNVLLLVLAVIV